MLIMCIVRQLSIKSPYMAVSPYVISNKLILIVNNKSYAVLFAVVVVYGV